MARNFTPGPRQVVVFTACMTPCQMIMHHVALGHTAQHGIDWASHSRMGITAVHDE
jgi:hypothetical protein